MALSVSSDCHRRLHSRQVLSDPEVHRGPLRPGVRPDGGGGLLLPPGGGRAGQKNQTTDLGHCRAGEVQVESEPFVVICYNNLSLTKCSGCLTLTICSS